jgi:hypothetical protein
MTVFAPPGSVSNSDMHRQPLTSPVNTNEYINIYIYIYINIYMQEEKYMKIANIIIIPNKPS